MRQWHRHDCEPVDRAIMKPAPDFLHAIHPRLGVTTQKVAGGYRTEEDYHLRLYKADFPPEPDRAVITFSFGRLPVSLSSPAWVVLHNVRRVSVLQARIRIYRVTEHLQEGINLTTGRTK
jgi:hypothetical protein